MSSTLGPLAIAPLGPLACGSLLVRVGRDLRAVVIAKATFALAHDRPGWLVDPAPLVEADRYRGGDPRKSLVAASDFVPFLPNAGITITGSARTMGGAPATTATAGFAIFRDAQVLVSKTVHVYGETTRSAPQPMPFVEMPIEYERAFGGSRTTDNPVGVGTDDTAAALPNVMNPTWDAATLDGGAFDAADLHEASLYRVSAVGVMAPDVDLRGANVQRIVAGGGTFSRARFAKADLRQAMFKGAQLDEAHFRGAQAGLANFEGANLARADLTEGAFREAIFTEADLSSARLDRADLREANLERANIHGATRQGTNSAGAKTAGIVETAAKPGR